MVETQATVLLQERGQPSRRFPADQLPLTLGEAGADIVMAGIDGAAQLGFLDGRFYLQGDRQRPGFRVNHELVQGSRWLVDGDEIAIANIRVACVVAGATLTLRMERRSSVGDTAPPGEAQSAQSGDDEIIPVQFRVDSSQPVPRQRWSRSHWAVAGGFALLALLGWFAFTAKSVALQFTPLPDELELPGTIMKLQLSDRFLLRRGEHHVVAEKAGYHRLDTTFQVGADSDQLQMFNLVKLPGLLTIVTNPQMGNLEVDVDAEGARLLGADSLELAAGTHRLELRAPRFLPLVEEVEVFGEGKEQSLSVQLTPDWAPVTLTTTPAGAEVQVDGDVVGVTPLILELTQGERVVDVRLAGFNAWQQSIEVTANEPLTLPPVALTRADGRVRLVTEPSGAAIAVDGVFRGRSPATVKLAPGRAHRIAVSKPGYQSQTKSLSVAADSGRQLTLQLAPELGRVAVRTEPLGAQLFVDGVLQSAADSELTLTTVPHRLEARADGFSPLVRIITPRSGLPQQVVLKLEALVTTVAGRFPSVVVSGAGQRLLLVQPAEFAMGSSRREQGRRSNEVLRRVRQTVPYYVGEREITNGEFRQFMADHRSEAFAGTDLDADDQPVVGVTWEDAVEYCNWLSIKDGLQPFYDSSGSTFVATAPFNRSGYRLPTEAEWAYIARYAGAAEPRRFPWGDELPPPDRAGNYADISARGIMSTTLVTYSDGFPVSAPVAKFPANPLGFYDLDGNVAEWVHDLYGVVPSQADEILENSFGPARGRFHVVRGASYRSASLTQLRLSYREYRAKGREDIGFRIARGAQSPATTADAEITSDAE
jgi:formylglycine-generating enzyme required for sulfatase activity